MTTPDPGTAYSARIQPRRIGWSVEIVHWPAGVPWASLAEEWHPWTLTHRGALRKAMRILRRRRAAANRQMAELEVFP